MNVSSSKPASPSLMQALTHPKALAPRTWMGMVWALGLAALVGSAWLTSQWAGWSAGSDRGYWVGVAGGLTMLALLAYPVRKRASWLRSLGATRTWFVAHMLLGVAGPWLILVHCNFKVGSVNAAVALYSMLLVASSGVVGRFLYKRIHRGLSGQRQELQELQAQLRDAPQAAKDQLSLVPRAALRIAKFQQQSLTQSQGGAASLKSAAVLWWKSRSVLQWVALEIDAAAQVRPWVNLSSAEREHFQHAAMTQADQHIAQALRVALFSTWERWFSLWHVAHVPFVVVMVVCALFHVMAVHAY